MDGVPMLSYAWARGVALVGAASILVTACSGDDATDTEAVTIASLMGAPDDKDFDFNGTVEQIENAVAECMALEGWNYVPRKLPQINRSADSTEESEADRISREGLGFTYYMLNDGTSDHSWSTIVDHNETYISTLSEAERKAYDDSLYGTEEEQAADTIISIDPETGKDTTVFLGSVGCRGEGRDLVYGDDPTHSRAYQDAMQVYWDELETRTQADPRFIALGEEWSTCMNAAGYDYDNVEEFNAAIYVELQTRTDEVVGPDFFTDPTEGWSQAEIDEFWESATQDEIDALYSASPELTADQRAGLEAILADEVAVALAEHACSSDFDLKALAISTDVEEQYALEHADELKALGATLLGGE
jgi:hypothetical protein